MLLRCPECGREARRERELFRTRRRWRWALASLPVFAGAYAAMVGPSVVEQGVRAAIPGIALIYGPWDVRALAEPDMYPPPTGRIARFGFDELQRRLDEHRLSQWETGRLQARLRGAYERAGRLGITEEEREGLDDLERTPVVSTGETLDVDAVMNQLRAQGFSVELDGEAWAPGSWRGDIDRTAIASLRSFLDELSLNLGRPWTIVGRRVVFGDHRAIADTTRYAVIDLSGLAPVSVNYALPHDCSGERLDDGTRHRRVDNGRPFSVEQALTDFFDSNEWIPNGGMIADMSLLDDTMVIRARAATLERIERFLAGMRRAQASSGEVQNEDRHWVDGAQPADCLKWYAMMEIVDRFTPSDPSDITSGDAAAAWRNHKRWEALDRTRDLIQSTIDPDHWASNGGLSGRIAIIDSHLVISTSVQHHTAIAECLDRLRRGDLQLPTR